MNDTASNAADLDGAGEIEFFGVRLKVNHPRLASLLDGDGAEEVTVVVGPAGVEPAGSVDDVAAGARGGAAEARLEQAITSAGVTDVHVRRAGAKVRPEHDAPQAAPIEHPA